MPHFFKWSTSILFTSSLEALLTTKKITIGVVFNRQPFSKILKCRGYRRDLPAICKIKLLWAHIEEFSWHKWKFRFIVLWKHYWYTIRPDAFDKSALVMNFLINVEVTEILCRLILVAEWKTEKEITESVRWNFLKRFLTNSFTI